MVAELNFKVVVSTKDGKSLQKEVAGGNAESLMRKRIGESVDGSIVGCPGYELEITGGSDKAGFPMRKDIDGAGRKRILLVKGVGAKRKRKGQRQRKTVRGNTISQKTNQVNLKVLTYGKTKLNVAEEKPAEEKKEKPKEEKKVGEKPDEEKEEENSEEKTKS